MLEDDFLDAAGNFIGQVLQLEEAGIAPTTVSKPELKASTLNLRINMKQMICKHSESRK